MEWLARIDLVQAANAIVILIVGLAAGLGFRQGRRQPAAQEPDTVAVAGALVDSAAVKELTAAIEAQNVEHRQNRTDADRGRRLGHELVEAIEGLARELQEMRNELRMGRR